MRKETMIPPENFLKRIVNGTFAERIAFPAAYARNKIERVGSDLPDIRSALLEAAYRRANRIDSIFPFFVFVHQTFPFSISAWGKDLDLFIEACKAIASEAQQAPQLLLEAPQKCKVRRMDETAAARRPCLAG